MADPDEHCPGIWIEIDPDTGYCELGDECRNPVPEAHGQRRPEWQVEDSFIVMTDRVDETD